MRNNNEENFSWEWAEKYSKLELCKIAKNSMVDLRRMRHSRDFWLLYAVILALIILYLAWGS